MQKDELIEVGLFQLDNSTSPRPEALPKELAISAFASSIFAGIVYTSDATKISALIERRNSGVATFTSQ